MVLESIGAGIFVIILILAFTKHQDNDEFGKETFTPAEQVVKNGGSNIGLFLGIVAIVIIVIMIASAGG